MCRDRNPKEEEKAPPESETPLGTAGVGPATAQEGGREVGRDQTWEEDLLGQEEEAGLHPVGDEGPGKGSEQEHGATSFVGKNDFPGIFPVPSLERWVERDQKASGRRGGVFRGFR